MQVSRNRGLLYTLISLIVILSVTVLVIYYANGNFRRTETGFARESGLLSANSLPTGSQVFIDEKLTTATDDTLYIEPGNYQVKITKDGYWDWQKTLQIEKGLVTQTNAQLFPTAPSLTPLTFTGASTLLTSPDGQKVLYYTASNSAQIKNGWYILELSDSNLLVPKGPRQILADTDTSEYDLTTANFIWSPNSDQLLLLLPQLELLLDIDQLTDLNQQQDVLLSADQILADWQQEMFLRERQYLEKFPDEIINLATQSAINVYFSPDKDKLLYTATIKLTLPDQLVDSLPPVRSTQTQERSLQASGIYIYDRKEDTNFRVGSDDLEKYDLASLSATSQTELAATPSPTPARQVKQETTEVVQIETSPQFKLLLSQSDYSESLVETATTSAYRSLVASTSAQTARNFAVYHSPLFANTFQWFPNSQHIFELQTDTIAIKEYENTNQTSLFSGKIEENFVYPWPDGSRLLALTTFSPLSPPNLYAVELK